ncbi:PepSY-associated TM helix domain-containing protein [Kordiimonas pumila]|uniref:PepSY-associated TM helix domain-containing protein n=1 Tax=Kordiimonas pumila TaxID=2161677 RepID=UPI001D1669BB|nr:PepSY-associated TM helix domain-containing protein [Kordiimonas pumila]
MAENRSSGLGFHVLSFDGTTGELVRQQTPGEGSVGDVIVAAQYLLHTGTIMGFVGRVLVSVTGLVLSAISVTGLYLWWKKRSQRTIIKKRRRVV